MMILGIAWLVACSSDTPEQRIRDLIGAMADAAADEQIRPLARAIADDYRDLRGNDKRNVINLMRGFMLRTDDVLIFEDIQSVRLITADLAEADVSVRFAGADWQRLRLSGAQYRFQLELVRDGDDWQISSARWAEGGVQPR